ncbi:efflux RND transporter periplasmic adaptor subunit [Roseateles cellulosilyticus]|uniref:Efflux RND transporter periplasmic adaptor subunit n=1 Tax=Pelomonas cellulosilytica TaxID=2906762 RepID=A0ABS8XWQ0_9BURK|nr:efflux RND transporter periplasmic adaptor subunit [Pelomonas sp. P8]MCE4555663.1 efflux RND transporter periplasmic adaptor subunit [Pelomonas sp. P8]
MDRRVAAPRRYRLIAMGVVVALAMAVALVRVWPRGVPVALADVEIAVAKTGPFRDVVVGRATAQPLQSVLLDATEDGRVEQVLVKDGARVEAGQLLVVLSSTQRAQELMARSAEAAQQTANLATFRAGLMQAQAQLRRELTQGQFELERVRRLHERNRELAATGFLSPSALEDSADKLAMTERLVAQARHDSREELATRQQSIEAMQRAVTDLDKRLAAMRAASEGLAVRAPVAGRVTGLTLQVGESVRASTRIARLDSLGRFKLDLRLDEFHLARVHEGLAAALTHDGRDHALHVARIDPLVKDGRFSVELAFDADPPALQVGQGLGVRLTLGHTQQALLLPDAGFYTDTGGAWAFVLDADGRHARRRPLQLGRRADGVVEVLGGLQPGELVVVSPYRAFAGASALDLN